MHTSKWLHLLVSLLILTSCNSEKVTLENFDHESWKADRNACSGERTRYAESLLNQKDKLLGFNEMEMVETLGKPDQQEIYKRNEKFYYYFLEPSSACGNGTGTPRRLSIRFNAVGLSKEITTE